MKSHQNQYQFGCLFPKRSSGVSLLNTTINLLLDQIEFPGNISKQSLKMKDISIISSILQMHLSILVTGHLILRSHPLLSSPNPIKCCMIPLKYFSALFS